MQLGFNIQVIRKILCKKTIVLYTIHDKAYNGIGNLSVKKGMCERFLILILSSML